MTQTPLPNLPLHLMLSMGCWLSSPFALRCASDGLPRWNSSATNPLQAAVAQEAKNRASKLFSGLQRYSETAYKRDVREPAAIWKRGNARLLDYSQYAPPAADAPVALFVPSLINRYYILDLEEERSMARYFASQGIYTLVLDWDAPGKFEEHFSVADYVTEILNPAIEFLAGAAGQKISLIGYCMGGVLTVAAAQLAARHISRLALLATPWNFYCRAFAPFVLDERWLPMMEKTIAAQKQLPAEFIQSLFYLTDPWVFEEKFRRFATLSSDSRAAKDFVALERWVNDGVPMTMPAARECLIDWAQKNALMKGQWEVDGMRITPEKLKLPTFIAMPQNDHVVPRDCASALAESIKNAYTANPSAGHVGMIVGSKAKKELWQPLAEWLLTTGK